MPTRAAFLSDPTHKIVFLHSKHCSWLNQVEIWFSILVRKLLRRASFTSKAMLKNPSLNSLVISIAQWLNPSSGLTKAKP